MKAPWTITLIGVALFMTGTWLYLVHPNLCISVTEKGGAPPSVITEFPCGWNPLVLQAEIDHQRQEGRAVVAVVPTHSRDCLETTSRPALTIIFAPE